MIETRFSDEASLEILTEPLTIKIRGMIVNKKDALRPRQSFFRKTGKGMTYDEATVSLIDSAVIQIRSQWGSRAPVAHPRIEVEFTFPHKRRDRDGRLATLLDCLKAAGVIRDDNCQHCNGPIELLPAIVDSTKEEGAIVRIFPTA